MPESLSLAKSGEPTVSVNGSFIHSRYSPSAEADRYIDTLRLTPDIRIVVFLEPGLGYLCQALKKRRPDITAIAIHCSRFYANARAGNSGTLRVDSEWFPDSPIRLDDFLSFQIADVEADSVKVVDWKPSLSAYGKAVTQIAASVAVFLKRSAANARTVAHFGHRWVRNAIALASRASAGLRVDAGTAPIVIAASGPSLESALAAIREAQNENAVFVLAVSSAIKALDAAGIRTDLALATDGGAWAAFHLYDAVRKSIPVACSMTAAVPSGLLSSPLLLLRDQTRWQAAACEASALPTIATPQRGTVAATAVDLALAISTGPVYLAGFDFGVNRGRTHARPNALDRFHEDCADRLRPAPGAAYGRFIDTKTGGALAVYDRWMEEKLQNRDRILSLMSASASCSLLHRADRILPQASGNLPRLIAMPIETDDEELRRERISDRLRMAVSSELAAAKRNEASVPSLLKIDRSILGELAELLFPDEYAQALSGLRSGSLTLDSLERLAEKIYMTFRWTG